MQNFRMYVGFESEFDLFVFVIFFVFLDEEIKGKGSGRISGIPIHSFRLKKLLHLKTMEYAIF